jgi:trehalose 6-phosphate phosphatase
VSSATAPLDPLVSRAAESGVLLDFDGTLSPIVDDPASARPLDGATEVLTELTRSYRVVGVLSGRPVSFLAPLLPPGVVISGLYGLEVVRDGRRVDHPLGGSWREVIEDVARLSVSRGPAGMQVEPKGLSLTLHYRSRPDLGDEVEAWAARQASRSGLVARPARMSVELHPPIPADKGTALEELAVDLAGIAYVGDDLGDLPAFDALDRLAAAGPTHTLRVAVSSPESPTELVERADLVLDGPEAVLTFLRSLIPSSPAA